MKLPCLVGMLLAVASSSLAQLTDYQVFFGETNQADRHVILRRWRQNEAWVYLTLDS